MSAQHNPQSKFGFYSYATPPGQTGAASGSGTQQALSELASKGSGHRGQQPEVASGAAHQSYVQRGPPYEQPHYQQPYGHPSHLPNGSYPPQYPGPPYQAAPGPYPMMPPYKPPSQGRSSPGKPNSTSSKFTFQQQTYPPPQLANPAIYPTGAYPLQQPPAGQPARRHPADRGQHFDYYSVQPSQPQQSPYSMAMKEFMNKGSSMNARPGLSSSGQAAQGFGLKNVTKQSVDFYGSMAESFMQKQSFMGSKPNYAVGYSKEPEPQKQQKKTRTRRSKGPSQKSEEGKLARASKLLGKKRRKRVRNYEAEIEKGGSSQDKFESDFIDDGDQQVNYSESDSSFNGQDGGKKAWKAKKGKFSQVNDKDKSCKAGKKGPRSGASQQPDKEPAAKTMKKSFKETSQDEVVPGRRKKQKLQTKQSTYSEFAAGLPDDFDDDEDIPEASTSPDEKQRYQMRVKKGRFKQKTPGSMKSSIDEDAVLSRSKDSEFAPSVDSDDPGAVGPNTQHEQSSRRTLPLQKFSNAKRSQTREDLSKKEFELIEGEDGAPRYFLGDDFSIDEPTFDGLFQHQKEGVRWLYSLWKSKLGAVLGDDMGLGKTVQVAAYLKGLFEEGSISKVLIIVPATMKTYWQSELERWWKMGYSKQRSSQSAFDQEQPASQQSQLSQTSQPTSDYQLPEIIQFDNQKRKERQLQMKRIRKQGGVLITSYGMVSTESMDLTSIRFDIVIVDEGHKAKNVNTQFRKDLTYLKVKGHRVVLTGTPLQNHLVELWSVFDFVQPKIFGSFERFSKEFVLPIERGLLNDCTEKHRREANILSSDLRSRYQRHFLRRKKDKIFTVTSAELAERPLLLTEMPLKTDLVVWVPLAKEQKTIYKYILQNKDLQEQIKSRSFRNAFFMLSYIKKLCLHPYLLCSTSLQKKKDLGLLSSEEQFILKEQTKAQREAMAETAGIRTRRGKVLLSNIQNSPVKTEADLKADKHRQTMFEKFGMEKILGSLSRMYTSDNCSKLIDVSVKTRFLFELLAKLKAESGPRVLIFSMSKKMLDLVELIFKSKHAKEFKYLRIDGDTEISEREAICTKFNEDPSYFCCLLTTKVGGFGLNLTGASRAVILDPDWNPANDNQAVDRCYRIGQKKDVIVYRLVTVGGIEELIYRRQVYKKAMNLHTIEATDNADTSGEKVFQKYFNDADLFELFSFDDSDQCETQKLLLDRDGFEVQSTPTNDQHLAFLRGLEGVVSGLSVNSRLFSTSSS